MYYIIVTASSLSLSLPLSYPLTPQLFSFAVSDSRVSFMNPIRPSTSSHSQLADHFADASFRKYGVTKHDLVATV